MSTLATGLIGGAIFAPIGFVIGHYLYKIACWRNGFGLNFIFVGLGLLAVAILVVSIWRHS